MRGPPPAPVTLSDAERMELERLVRAHQTGQQVAKRARMILAAATGQNNSEIARAEGTDADRVRRWRMRWLGLQAVALTDLSVEERLTDAPRPGVPARITAEQVCQIIALACEQPHERPISHWTGRELADEIVRRGIVARISPRHAARLLKKGISSRIAFAIG